MLFRLLLALLAFSTLALIAVPARATDQPVLASAPLTDDQIRKFFNSYGTIHAMARQYWGERRYTPKNKMLDPPGTIERAFEEMRAAGTLPEFENLLQSNGFADRAAWLGLAHRISLAYVTLRMPEKYPVVAERLRKSREGRIKFLAKQREKLQQIPEGLRRANQIKTLNYMQDRLDREALAEHDAESLRHFASYFEQMDKYMFEGMQ